MSCGTSAARTGGSSGRTVTPIERERCVRASRTRRGPGLEGDQMTNRWRRVGRLWQAGAFALVAMGEARAQGPPPPSGPASSILPRYGYWGTKTCRDTFIGRPELFQEPPPGAYLNEHLALMHAKADP